MSIETRLANNERCQMEYGLSTYDASEKDNLADVYSQMWLPEESLELVDLVHTHRGITLIGEVGSGKSALLYGARTIMRAHGIPYVYINGHFKDTPSEDVINIIDQAEEKSMTIVYDSADYLAAGKRKLRALPLKEHIPRNIAIMQRLLEYRQQDGTLLMTSHHADWINDISHPDLLPVWDQLVYKTTQQEVNIVLSTYEQRARLLEKMGIDTAITDFISQLPDNPDFIDHIVNKWGDKKYVEWAKNNLSTYQTLKLLVKDNYGENLPVIQAISDTLATGKNVEESWDSVLDFIYSKTFLLTFFSRL